MAKPKKDAAGKKKEFKPEREKPRGATEIFTPTRLIVMFLIIEVFIILLMKDSYYIQHHTAKARQALKEKRFEVAKKHYLKLLKIAPDSATVNLELAQSYEGLADYERAITHYSRALENATSPLLGINSQIGLCYIRKGNRERALEYFQREYKINPRESNANFYLGEENFKKGNYHQAAQHFQTIAYDNRFREKLKEYWKEIEEKFLSQIQTSDEESSDSAILNQK